MYCYALIINKCNINNKTELTAQLSEVEIHLRVNYRLYDNEAPQTGVFKNY